jgi:cobalt-zinc-cadmium efflux system membrane fusion protein
LREADIAVSNARQKLAAVGATAASTGLNRFEIVRPSTARWSRSTSRSAKPCARTPTSSRCLTSAPWAEFAVAQDLAIVRVGQKVVVTSTAFPERWRERFPTLARCGEQTRTARARVTLANPQGAWRPGLFVTVRVLGAEQASPSPWRPRRSRPSKTSPWSFRSTAVSCRASQGGRSDGKTVEIPGGLTAGEAVVTDNAYVLKAEQGKSSAERPLSEEYTVFERIIRFCIEQRWLVMLAVLAMAGLGVFSYTKLASTPSPTSPTSRSSSTPARRATRRWRPSNASPIPSRP